MKVERVSYEVITPSAARGVLDAILWRPEMRWVIRRIEVLRPIRFIGFRRNEVQSKIAPRSVREWMRSPDAYQPQPAGAGSDDATPRNTLALRDVAYVIEAIPLVFSPNTENTPAKYVAMLDRRVERGQHWHAPYLGCREFACAVSLPDPDERPIDESRDLGLMLYDVAFHNDTGASRAVFFQACLNHGVLDVAPESVLTEPRQRAEVLACSYKH